MKKIFITLFVMIFANTSFAETIVTFHKPYGCKVVVEGKKFYFQELGENLPAFPYNFKIKKNENIYQIQKDIESGKYGFSITWKRAFHSKNIMYFTTIKNGSVNNITFDAPAWCKLKELGEEAWGKTRSGTKKGVDVSKDLGEKGVKKASELLQKVKEKLAD